MFSIIVILVYYILLTIIAWTEHMFCFAELMLLMSYYQHQYGFVFYLMYSGSDATPLELFLKNIIFFLKDGRHIKKMHIL